MKVKQFIGLMILALSPMGASILYALYQTEFKPNANHAHYTWPNGEVKTEREVTLTDEEKRLIVQDGILKAYELHTESIITRLNDEIQIIKDSGENSSDIKSGRLEYLQHNLIYATRIKKLIEKMRDTGLDYTKEVEIQVELQERNQYNYEQGKYKQSNVCQKEIKW